MTLSPPPLAETEKLAAQMLAQPNPVAALSLAEAMVIVDMMRPKRIAAGTVFISEGEAEHTDYMVLVLAGDVAIENRKPSSTTQRLINIVGPGTVLGDMSLVDGSPRLTTSRAQTELSVAIFTRARLQELLTTHPVIAAKFLLTLHLRASQISRMTLGKFNKIVQINDVLRQQMDAVMNSRSLLPNQPHPAAPAAAFQVDASRQR
ncbi:MAG: cyclic nucleotide-binding domain-containing protein [Brachymonas sp.]